MIALWPLAVKCGYCNLFGAVRFKEIQCKSRSLQKGMHAPIETRSEWNYAYYKFALTSFQTKFDNRDDLTSFECISEMVLGLSFWKSYCI